MPAAISATGLGKRFRAYHPDRPWTLQEALMRGGRLKPARYFWGVRDLSFEIQRGRMAGVIGRNGAGKSTLLRLLGGLLRPDRGALEVRGHVSGLLELGAGFHSDLTGRENLFIAGTVGGLTRREVAARFDSIVQFAELERFIDAPLRTYSSGMQMRLAFSVAVHVEPEVLLVDEVLAVGDLAFQRKCLDKILEFRSRGCTIMVVSHDLNVVRELCDEALWLEQGALRASGSAEEVVLSYIRDASQETLRRTGVVPPLCGVPEGAARAGSMEVQIRRVELRSADRLPVREFAGGDPVAVTIEYYAPALVRGPVFHVSISDDDGRIHLNAASDTVASTVASVSGHGRVSARIEHLYLAPGRYYVDVGVYENEWRYAYDHHWHAYPISVCSGAAGRPAQIDGNSDPNVRWLIA